MNLRVTLTVTGVIAMLAVILLLKTFHDAGEFKSIVSRCDCACVEFGGVAGAEDITIDPETGRAFISSDHRRAAMAGMAVQGAIYGFDTRAANAKPVRLTADLPFDFHPHGIGFYRGDGSGNRLFVVNHRADGHYIEIFEWRRGKLVHMESIGGALMHSPNDVAAAGARSFYVTNDHGNTSAAGRMAEEYLQLKRSYVLYYDGSTFRIVAGGVGYANGIALSADGGTVYVASSVGRNLLVYGRDIKTGTLSPGRGIDAGFGLDNIEVDADGSLWIAGHPRMLTFLRHAADAAVPSPSRVVRIELKSDGKAAIREVFQDDGMKISAASVAAPFPDGFLVGAVFDERFLVCRTSGR
ncbi:MAG TPA: SMP-30/gluconolactonase/LRE family protein [Spirochaetota bacterium]|nr:SMP-30/gluconolactonase/LRE family protein [Spirochaetota bacterium]